MYGKSASKSLINLVGEWSSLLPVRNVRGGWEFFKSRSFFPVEQESFPEELPPETGGKYPCTDGAIVWIPWGQEAVMIALFLHETAHALLHYPNGPDRNFWDTTPEKYASMIEAEACAVAYLVAEALGLEAFHNREYILRWMGNVEIFERDSKERVLAAARKMIDRFTGMAAAA